jgi:hypothetical protein
MAMLNKRSVFFIKTRFKISSGVKGRTTNLRIFQKKAIGSQKYNLAD